MFGMLSSLESWTQLARRALVTMAMLMLAPAAVVALGLLAMMLAPVAVVGIPFMLVSFYGSASTEHYETRRRSALRHTMPAMAH